MILEVTELWLSSINLSNLLYFNLAPYLFNSVDSEYLVTLVWTTLDTKVAEGAIFVL